MKNLFDPTELARLFHTTYERLAPNFGYETREETKTFDPLSPNGQLMVAVSADVLYKLMQNAMAGATIGTCRRCGAPDSYKATLAGGYITSLCLDCMNKWHLFTIYQEEFVQYVQDKAEHEAVIHNSSYKISNPRETVEFLLSPNLFHIGENWVLRGPSDV